MAQIAFFYETTEGLNHMDFLEVVEKHCKTYEDYLRFSANFARKYPNYAKEQGILY